MLSAIPTFLTQVKDELHRVIWPKRDEVVKLTGQVIAISIICAIFIGACDFIFTELINITI